MKPRLQPMASLYFRWGKFHGFESFEVAKILSAAGLITLVGKEHFQEKRFELGLDWHEFEMLVKNALEKEKL